MAKQGWEVYGYEPDPIHHQIALANIQANPPALRLWIMNQALSDKTEFEAVFIRVGNNTTSSHLEGDKQPYGPVERLMVHMVDCRALIERSDFAKVDCEGHEATILLTVEDKTCEFMVEITNQANANKIYEHFKSLDIGMWSQKIGWQEVKSLEDVPNHHSQGHLFIGNHKP